MIWALGFYKRTISTVLLWLSFSSNLTPGRWNVVDIIREKGIVFKNIQTTGNWDIYVLIADGSYLLIGFLCC